MQGLITKKSYCPYCGEPIDLILDTSVAHQTYIEDCQVCCRPMQVSVTVATDGFIDLQIRNENE